MKLTKRAKQLQPSATLAITAKSKALKAQGIPVIGFGAGEPDFDTPENIKHKAIEAIDSGFTKYTAVGGIDELKSAIAQRISEDYALEYALDEITVSCGAKHSLYNIAQVLFEEGDEVLIPSPYWVSYPEQVSLAGASPVIIPAKEENGFKIGPEELQALISPRTKALILNYPSNPTGSTYTREELERLAEVTMKNGIIVISDEIYDKTIYGDTVHVPFASLAKDVKAMTLLVNGVSKTYSMTGWRIGYTAGDKGVISAMNKLQGQCTSNPSSISQMAAIEAFAGTQGPVDKMVSEFEKRKDYIVDKLNSMPGIDCFDPRGAFYVFPNVSATYGSVYGDKKIENSLDFTEYLLDEAKIAVVPGVAFGDDSYVRISYATSMEDIVEGMDRMASALAKLGQF